MSLVRFQSKAFPFQQMLNETVSFIKHILYYSVFERTAPGTEESGNGLLAQVVEHLTFNQVVAGSSPAWLMYVKSRNIADWRGFPGFFTAKNK